MERPKDRQRRVVGADGFQNGERQVFVHQIQEHQIGVLGLQQSGHPVVGRAGIDHLAQHLYPACQPAVHRGIGNKIFRLRAGQILGVFHREKNHGMPGGRQRLGQREVVGLAAALAVVEFVDQ